MADIDAAVGGGGADAGPETVLFAEPFDDADFASRGWYDSSGGTIAADGAFECHFGVGDTVCSGGTPGRAPIPPSESVTLRFRIKLSANWVGSGRPYHPHMFHFVTDADDDYVGPANTHLTTYVEIVEDRPLIALQDSRNVDPNCILRNDDSFVGCDGDFASYVFTESRSVAACNGLVGDVDGRDCFMNGAYWYSARSWDADTVLTKDVWHAVEATFVMNSILAGAGIPDGEIRFVLDGQTVFEYDQILFRTSANATIAFDQFLMLPYIGDGSPVDQRFWIDDLEITTGR